MRFRGFRAENLGHVGWKPYRVASYVNWCGHAQESSHGRSRTGWLPSCRYSGRRGRPLDEG